ncbi:MAG: CheR family methyltransferase [Brevundimonas sp.]|jgi:chemotaxis protein methyltransferase CheR|uniref:CheR family methyltransferase n=1 Tax=Brevundimonas sp. TaxID=1871086 RepID=UPI00391A44FB
MQQSHFDALQALLASRSGYHLDSERAYLVAHRLAPLARRENHASVAALLESVLDKPVGALGWAVIEAMLNTETWFMRDRRPFRSFRDELAPALSRARPGGRVRALSMGCSLGQEAYSLAMCALEAGAKIEITAADLSGRALDKAQSGLYTQFEVQRGLSARKLLDHFEKAGDMWSVAPHLKSPVRFVRANVLDEPVDTGFDVIFCRYVLAEMAPRHRVQALDTLAQSLAPDGCLFLGENEAVAEAAATFRPVAGRAGLYVKTPIRTARSA